MQARGDARDMEQQLASERASRAKLEARINLLETQLSTAHESAQRLEEDRQQALQSSIAASQQAAEATNTLSLAQSHLSDQRAQLDRDSNALGDRRRSVINGEALAARRLAEANCRGVVVDTRMQIATAAESSAHDAIKTAALAHKSAQQLASTVASQAQETQASIAAALHIGRVNTRKMKKMMQGFSQLLQQGGPFAQWVMNSARDVAEEIKRLGNWDDAATARNLVPVFCQSLNAAATLRRSGEVYRAIDQLKTSATALAICDGCSATTAPTKEQRGRCRSLVRESQLLLTYVNEHETAPADAKQSTSEEIRRVVPGVELIELGSSSDDEPAPADGLKTRAASPTPARPLLLESGPPHPELQKHVEQRAAVLFASPRTAASSVVRAGSCADMPLLPDCGMKAEQPPRDFGVASTV